MEKTELTMTVVLSGGSRIDIAGLYPGSGEAMKELSYNPRSWRTGERRRLPVSMVARLQRAGIPLAPHIPGDDSFELPPWHEKTPPKVDPKENDRSKREKFRKDKFVRVMFTSSSGSFSNPDDWRILGYSAGVEKNEIRAVPAALAETFTGGCEVLEGFASDEIEAQQMRYLMAEYLPRVIGEYPVERDRIEELSKARRDAIREKNWKKSAKLELETRMVWLNLP